MKALDAMNMNDAPPHPTTQYAISEWHDTNAIYAQLQALLKEPVRPIRRDKMTEVLAYFETHCQGSKALAERAGEVIPGGVQHNLAFNYPFPLAVDRCDGAHMWDVDGNRYIDFLQAGGPTLLGSNYPPVREKVHALLDHCGPVTGMVHEYEIKLAELIRHYMPGIEMFRMLGSGSEGVMGAIRLARAYTDKKWVIKVGGAYHGWSDQMVYGMRLPGTGRREATGIPGGATHHTQECFPNDLDALRRKLWLNRLRGGTAAVIVEPLGPESGTRPVEKDYNAGVRALCDEFGALLIFDEVVTGFRLGMGGAQGYFGVKPDLTVFGKCLTGGYLMAGGVGGRKDVMMLLAGGIGALSKRAFVGGTLSANPLSCVAGYHAITEMARSNAPVVAGQAGDRLCRGLQEIIGRRQLPYVAYNQGSIVHLQTSAVLLLSTRNPIKLMKEVKARKHMMEEMGAAYMAHGIVTLAGSRLYTSMADTDAVIDEALNRFDTVLGLV
ncbi:aspartate aminotransferase family protein [Chitinimonas naiadis]